MFFNRKDTTKKNYMPVGILVLLIIALVTGGVTGCRNKEEKQQTSVSQNHSKEEEQSNKETDESGSPEDAEDKTPGTSNTEADQSGSTASDPNKLNNDLGVEEYVPEDKGNSGNQSSGNQGSGNQGSGNQGTTEDNTTDSDPDVESSGEYGDINWL